MKPLRFLYLSYFLPPLGRAESRHNVAWLRELIACGWSAEVVTASEGERYPKDGSLSSHMPAGADVQVHRILKRTEGGRLYRKIRFRAGLIDLIAIANYEAYLDYVLQLHAEEPFDFVYSVYGVPLSHEIAYHFKQETKRPWVAEFRDPLVHNYILQTLLDTRCWKFWSTFQRGKLRDFERRVVENADLVVVESPRHDQQLVEEYCVSNDKVVPLGVGYDSQQFPVTSKTSHNPDRPLRIGYIGSLYEGYEKLAERIVEGLANSAYPVELIVAGDDRAVFKGFADRFGLDHFDYKGRVDQIEALGIMQSLDVGLIMIDQQYELINSKFWEYLYAGLSIVALAPKSGAMSEWLLEHNAGYVLPYDGEGIKVVLQAVTKDARDGKLKRADSALVEHYDAPVIVGEISERIRQIIEHKGQT